MEGNALNPRCSCLRKGGVPLWPRRVDLPLWQPCAGRLKPHLPPQIAIGRPFVGTESVMTRLIFPLHVNPVEGQKCHEAYAVISYNSMLGSELVAHAHACVEDKDRVLGAYSFRTPQPRSTVAPLRLLDRGHLRSLARIAAKAYSLYLGATSIPRKKRASIGTRHLNNLTRFLHNG